MLAVALLAMVLYAAFAHGAAADAAAARIEVAIAAVAALAAAAGLWAGTLRFSAPPLALTGVALLLGFAVWSGITVLWSVAPNQTWIECNRALAYVIVLGLAITLGASEPRAPRWIADGFLAVSLLVTVYALGQKLLPGLHLAGIINLNQTGPLPRLQEPFGYWNALALFVAMGAPFALARAVDRSRRERDRLGGLIALELMFLVVGFTYSRGGMIALVLSLAVGVAISGACLRSLMWLAIAALGLIAPLAFGLSDHALTTANIALGSRENAGLLLLSILIASTAILLLGASKVVQLEGSIRVGPERARMIGRMLAGALAAAMIVGVLAVAFSSRGLGGTVSHAWSSFTTTRAASVYQPGRLLSVDSENRWVWWKEAAGAFTARPIAGWGAGSFAVVHLLYRRDTLSVNQPHSVPLQFLAETGIVGALLGLGALVILLIAGIRTVRRLAPGSQRLLSAALLTGSIAYMIHSLYDWDWNIPGVTLPALVLLGVVLGADRVRPRSRAAPREPGAALRVAAIAISTLAMCTFALSSALPSIAASDASSAIVEAASASSSTVAHGQADAQLAAELDPLSDAGPRVEATIAVRRGQLRTALAYLVDAVRREPTDGQAWLELAYVESALRDARDAIRARERVIALDPDVPGVRAEASGFGQLQSLIKTPPRDSPTAHPLLAP